MGRHDVLQQGSVELAQNLGGGSVIQMAETPRHPLLQAGRVWAIAQHLRIVVAFQHQRMATAQDRFNMGRGTTGVSEHPKPPRAVAEHELRRLAGIMRHRKGFDFQIADGKTVMAIEKVKRLAVLELSAGMAARMIAKVVISTVRQPYRNIEFARERRHSANVVGMFMRHHNRAQLIGR
jgi:hypothetical protein